MAVTQYNGNTNYISMLPDKPVTDGGLTAAQFKAKFDQFGTEFKTWFNNTFISALNSTFASKSAATTGSDGLMSSADKSKLDGIEAGAEANAVVSVAGKTGAVSITVEDVSDLNANQIRVIKIGTANPEDAGLVSGDIYLKIEEEES